MSSLQEPLFQPRAPNPPQPSAQLAERDRRARRSCIALLAAMATIAVVGGVVLLVGGYLLYQQPAVRRALGVLGSSAEVVYEAMNAPATRELQRQGCEQAAVFTPELFARFTQALRVDAGPRAAGELENSALVVCALSLTRDLSCDAAVRIYLDTRQHPTENVAVTITGQFDRQPRCQGLYGPDGTRLRDLDEEEAQRIGDLPSEQ